jgi:hypothetical protein
LYRRGYKLEVEFVDELKIAGHLLQHRIHDESFAATAAREKIRVGTWKPDQKKLTEDQATSRIAGGRWRR